MRVLFDTNIILDVLLERQPFSELASKLLSKVEEGEVSGLVCATTITTIYYLASKAFDRKKANECIELLLNLFEVASVNRIVIESAKKLNFKDFEDAVIYASALHSGCNCVVTRNVGDFTASEIPVFSPEELLKIIKIGKE
ncbi:Predicted nucleic acid-binding protein, contains PIN domain [Desulfurobacterium pacificum]|uniref:Predicted nucleic acid-binding protein, contains PIN domain n=1 Tax=Desulfurobacterium pacificum TaxID=240166 RepID=A0ABY1N989_9BACT|nr:PIN domain-containing protein [Desulfurobacterium pacificum]SMP03948.1 Predicted nucleic acid-binding protein, contains PIN domain [Desulfurobacterium pacificum]